MADRESAEGLIARDITDGIVDEVNRWLLHKEPHHAKLCGFVYRESRAAESRARASEREAIQQECVAKAVEEAATSLDVFASEVTHRWPKGRWTAKGVSEILRSFADRLRKAIRARADNDSGDGPAKEE